MRFQSYLPSAALQDVIDCFIISESDSETPYTVLPDTALVLGFQYCGGLSVLKDGQAEPLTVAGVTGLLKGFRLFRNEGSTGTVLVRFRPGGAAAFFRHPAHELLDQSLSLDLLADRHSLSLVEEQLQEADGDAARIGIVETFLFSRSMVMNADNLVNEAVRLIQESAGSIRIEALARQLHTSASLLEKRFRTRIGASPKTFAGIIRFRSIINSAKRTGSAASLAYDAGYSDQSHFIKDFSRFAGQTPEAFSRKESF